MSGMWNSTTFMTPLNMSGVDEEVFINKSALDADESKRDFVFDRIDVRIIFISLYSLVFCCCFIGKYLTVTQYINVAKE